MVAVQQERVFYTEQGVREPEEERLRSMGLIVNPATFAAIEVVIGPDAVILHVGPGTDTTLQDRIVLAGRRAIALDVNPEAVDAHARRGHPSFRAWRGEPLPDDLTYDGLKPTAIVKRYVAGHQGNSTERQEALRQEIGALDLDKPFAAVLEEFDYTRAFNAPDQPEAMKSLLDCARQAFELPWINFDYKAGATLQDEVRTVLGDVFGAENYSIMKYRQPVAVSREDKVTIINETVNSISKGLQIIISGLDGNEAARTKIVALHEQLLKYAEEALACDLDAATFPDRVIVGCRSERPSDGIKARPLGRVALHAMGIAINPEQALGLRDEEGNPLIEGLKNVRILPLGDDQSHLAMKARRFAGKTYWEWKHITDEGMPIDTDVTLDGKTVHMKAGKYAENVDPRERRFRSFILVTVDDEGNVQSTARLELPNNTGAASLPTTGRILSSKFPRPSRRKRYTNAVLGIPRQAKRMDHPVFGNHSAEIGVIVAGLRCIISSKGEKTVYDPIPSQRLSAAAVGLAQLLDIKTIVFSGVGGNGNSNRSFAESYGIVRTHYGIPVGVMQPINTLAGEQVVTYARGKGFKETDEGVQLISYYADIQPGHGFFNHWGNAVKFSGKRSNAHAQMLRLTQVMGKHMERLTGGKQNGKK